MPRPGASEPRKPFVTAWREELPRVAASLTTALILFLASLSFTPVRRWLFASDVPAYPLTCTADPVATADGRRLVEFYIVNRSRDNFTGEDLQRRLDEALRGSGASGSATIMLPFRDDGGRIERASADRQFNEGKGEIHVAHDDRGVRIAVREIHGGALLRVHIIVSGATDIGPVSRDAKVAVPFDYLAIQESCYTRR